MYQKSFIESIVQQYHDLGYATKGSYNSMCTEAGNLIEFYPIQRDNKEVGVEVIAHHKIVGQVYYEDMDFRKKLSDVIQHQLAY